MPGVHKRGGSHKWVEAVPKKEKSLGLSNRLDLKSQKIEPRVQYIQFSKAVVRYRKNPGTITPYKASHNKGAFKSFSASIIGLGRLSH
jgi:hypothetical protein